MSHSVIYPGDLDALIKKWKDESTLQLDNGQCARLPQVLTSVGWTGRWQRGPRVLDSLHLLAGTVIANFKIVNGQPAYPNEHGYHAALFERFYHGTKMTNGLPCEFSMVDQWVGKAPGERGVAILPGWFKTAHPQYDTPSNRADDFYVVLVP